jgi:hypothetical protein
MRTVQDVAPDGEVGAYDRRNLLTYAELIDADECGMSWERGAVEILGFEPGFDLDLAQRCWESHVARARWIVGDGLASAVEAFGQNSFR